MESRTQLFLLEDGSVQGGATDGPPPEAMCGFWQCGDYGFQVCGRSHARSLLPHPQRAREGVAKAGQTRPCPQP